MHKECAVCSAVDDTILGRPAAVVEPIDPWRPARAFPTVSDALDCKSSRIDKIHKPIRKPWIPRNQINRPARMLGIVVLAA